MIHTRRRAGTSVFRISKRLGVSSAYRVDTPVTLPPGWAMLLTKPPATGSPTVLNTMGIVVVVAIAARVDTSFVVTMTSTWLRASSAAAAGSADTSPSV